MSTRWFEDITGFAEADYASTRARLAVESGQLVSLVNGARRGIGHFETPTLQALRERAHEACRGGARTTLRCIVGDARALHADPGLAGATFQVASQFNALEMVSPNVTPEHGVTRYAHDATQGPACAMAAGAATIWRNYFMPVDGQPGQTAQRQLDTLAGTGALLSEWLGRPVHALWTMRNGYALANPEGLRDIGRLLGAASEERVDRLRGSLAVAWQRDAEVTDLPPAQGQGVSQVFCSALPVSYTRIAPPAWEPFARLVLEAAYEATLLAAALQRASGGSNIVLLTRLGGGAFGNADAWIDDAIRHALSRVAFAGLDLRCVSRGAVHASFERLAADWALAGGA